MDSFRSLVEVRPFVTSTTTSLLFVLFLQLVEILQKVIVVFILVSK